MPIDLGPLFMFKFRIWVGIRIEKRIKKKKHFFKGHLKRTLYIIVHVMQLHLPCTYIVDAAASHKRNIAYYMCSCGI